MFAWRRLLKRKVLVHLHNGDSFEGVLWKRHRDHVQLRESQLVPRGLENGNPVDGMVLIERMNIAYFQFVNGTG